MTADSAAGDVERQRHITWHDFAPSAATGRCFRHGSSDCFTEGVVVDRKGDVTAIITPLIRNLTQRVEPSAPPDAPRLTPFAYGPSGPACRALLEGPSVSVGMVTTGGERTPGS
jgi:hypothetical protein